MVVGVVDGGGVLIWAVTLETLGALVGGGVAGGGVDDGGCCGVGFGFCGAGWGFGFCGVGCDAGCDETGWEISDSDGCVTTVRARVRAGRCRTGRAVCTTWRGGMCTVGGEGAGWTTRGVAATRSSAGELDSNAARQR